MNVPAYIDEVGTDDVASVDGDNERYLSLTGIAMKIDEARDNLAPRFAEIKAKVFEHDPDEPVIFHRKKIVKRSEGFRCLADDEKRAAFDTAIFEAMQQCEYHVITALIDKRAMLRKLTWVNKEPYHYLMEVLVEKYAKFLRRKDDIGDIMPEGRKGNKDQRLQQAFLRVKQNGTYYASQALISRRIPSSNLKFRYKKDNVAGLQLADMIAHPSHMTVRDKMGHPVTLGSFCKQVKGVLEDSKYDRAWNGSIVGYGMKWLP
jgi:hypothetical protein